LFPSVERLTILERKYGDAISKEDLFGFKEKKRKKKKSTLDVGEENTSNKDTSIRDTSNRDATTNRDGETSMSKS